MEQDRFDALAISLADEGTSRRSVLGRLAAGGVAAALGITAFTAFEEDEADAKKKARKRKICVCTGNTVASCQTKKIKRRKIKKIIKKNPCSYGGKCNGTNPCSQNPTTCSTAATCPAGQGCVNGVCGDCSGNASCRAEEICTTAGDCVTPGATCDSGNCPDPLVCVADICVVPSDPTECDPACGTGLICLGGICVLPGSDATCDVSNCAAPLACVGNLCVANGLSTCSPVCTAPLTCVAGICVGSCTDSSDCSGGLLSLCVAGICVAV